MNFNATTTALWMTNPDGSLYCPVRWDEVKSASLDEDTGVWHLSVAFFAAEFGFLRLEPLQDSRDRLASLLATLA